MKLSQIPVGILFEGLENVDEQMLSQMTNKMVPPDRFPATNRIARAGMAKVGGALRKAQGPIAKAVKHVGYNKKSPLGMKNLAQASKEAPGAVSHATNTALNAGYKATDRLGATILAPARGASQFAASKVMPSRPKPAM